MSNITIYYQNARSIRGKLIELQLTSLSCNYDVIVITESWLNESVMDAEILNDNYVIYRRDRCTSDSSKHEGGGVLIAVLKSLNSTRKFELESLHEDIWVQISSNNNKINICAIYLPLQCHVKNLKLTLIL